MPIRTSDNIRINDNGTGKQVTIQIPEPLNADTTYTLPSADGVAGTALVTDGTGHLTWAAPSGGGSDPSRVARAGDSMSGALQMNAQNAVRFADADSSNYVGFKGAATIPSNVNWTLPSADGSSGQVLTTDGSATLAWATVTSGANTALSNLTSPTALNQDIIFSKSSPILKSANNGAGATQPLVIESGDATGGNSGSVFINSGTAPNFLTGNVTVASAAASNGSSGNVMMQSGSSSGNSNTSGSLSLITGAVSGAAFAQSGNINLQIGTAVSGTRGKITIVDGSEGTSGQVWTSTDTVGSGHWAALPSGGANTALSNLTTTSINQDFLPDADSTRALGSGSDTWERLFVAKAVRFKNTTQGGILGPLETQTSPLGTTTLLALANLSAAQVSVYTGSNATNDANATGRVTLETGNKTAGTGDSGHIQVQTGTSVGGLRGAIHLNGDDVQIEGDGTKAGLLKFNDADNSNYLGLRAPVTVSSNVVWTLPSADGASGNIFTTNGTGATSWGTVLKLGTVSGGGSVTASGASSIAHGLVSAAGTIVANGVGAYAAGNLTAAGNIQAGGNGSMAFGEMAGAGSIAVANASAGNGSMAFGRITSTGSIAVNSTGALGFGNLTGTSSSITVGSAGGMAFGASVSNSAAILSNGLGALAFGNPGTSSTITASGAGSMAFGASVSGTKLVTASGTSSFAAGQPNTDQAVTATATNSFAFGDGNQSSGTGSTSFGQSNLAQSFASLIIGRYGATGGTAGSWVSTDPAFLIGNGTAVGSTATAFEVDKDGKLIVTGAHKNTAIRSVSTNTTLSARTDYTVLADTTSSAIVFTLPAGENGLEYWIKDSGASAATHNITFTPNGTDTVESGATININGGKRLLRFFSGQWWVVGTELNSTLPIANGGTGQVTASAAFGAFSPLITKGDLLSFSTVNARVPIGSDGQVLTADSAQTLGLKWATPATSGGTVTSVALTVPSFLSVSGSPVTTSGTLAVSLSGTALPVANGGTGTTNGSITGTTALALAAGGSNQNVSLTPTGTGIVTVSTSLSTGSVYEGFSGYTNSSTAVTIPDTSVSVVRYTLTGNATITFPAFTAPSSRMYNLTLFLKQDGTGSRTVTYAGNGSDTFKWDGGVTPSISPTAGKITILQFVKSADETVWYASKVWSED